RQLFIAGRRPTPRELGATSSREGRRGYQQISVGGCHAVRKLLDRGGAVPAPDRRLVDPLAGKETVMTNPSGVIAAAVTAFKDDYSLDIERTQDHLDHLVQAGVDG